MAIPDRDYQVGDVVWCVDPFKLGADHSRLFAVISTRTHPFEDEQFLGAAITTTDHTVAHPLKDTYWEYGGTPKPSYILSLSLHSPRTSQIQPPPNYDEITDPWQGRLSREFIRDIVDEITWTLRRLN